jgi:hypothetical protein
MKPASVKPPTKVTVFQVHEGSRRGGAGLSAPAQACHLGRKSALVDEDQILGVKPGLVIEPSRAGRPYVGALFARWRAPSFFMRLVVMIE